MKTLVVVILSFTCSLAIGQNLVKNGSIENTGPCPVTGTVFEDFAEPWTNYFGTPDYYLPECAAPGHPDFTLNEQPFDGDAFAGIHVYGDSGTAFIREYIHGELDQPLEAGRHYRVTFYVKPVNENSLGLGYGSNNIGMALTEAPMDSVPSENIYPVEPQVVSTDVIANENYWTAVCGVYLAKGGEQYITIGNFNTDFETSVTPLEGATNPVLSYYLIDYVQVLENDLPELPADTIICDDQRIDLRVDGPDVEVFWESTTSDLERTSTSKDFYIERPGIYTARISTPGCSYTDTLVVEEANCYECKLFIPNAFRPDGDHPTNNKFVVYPEEGCDFLSYRINIFDRWGQKVFESNSPDVHWDGRSDGKIYPQGVYTYTIEYEYAHLRESQTLTERGKVLLVQ